MGLFTDGFKLLKKASEPLYKTPKSIQETIEIMAVAENGIFEVSKNKYSKCYRFCDINYTTATEDEQIGIFEGKRSKGKRGQQYQRICNSSVR